MKTKLTLVIVLAALCGGVGFFLGSRKEPVTVEKVVQHEVIKYVDRAVDRNVVITETKPDGTRVVTVDTSKEHTLETEKTRHKESVKVTPVLSKYSLGVSVHPQLTLADFRPTFDYEVEVGRRISSTPFWVTFSYNTKHEWTLGLRAEF